MFGQKNKIYKILKFGFIFLTYVNTVMCVDIGSDNSVDKFNTQQILNNDDRVAGFACLIAGFKLGNSAVTATFDSFFPVKGDVKFNCGTLELSRDLIFRDFSSILSLGNIIGNNYKMELAPSITNINTIVVGQDGGCGAQGCELALVANSSWQPDDVFACDWSYDNKFLAIGLDCPSSGDRNTLRIYEFDGATLTLKDTYNLNNRDCDAVCWHPSEHLLAVGNKRTNKGDELRIFQIDSLTGVLSYISGKDTGAHVEAIEWHPTGNWIAVGQRTTSADVSIYAVDAQGNINTTAVVAYNAPDIVKRGSISWRRDGNYLAVGLDSNGTSEVLVFEFNQETESLTLKVSINESNDVCAISWSKVHPRFLAIGVYLTSGDMLKIYEFDSEVGTLTQRASRSDLADYVWALDWHPTSNCLALGRDSGAGNDFIVYYFDATNYSLDIVSEFDISADVTSVKWSPDGNYIVAGSKNNYFYIYSCAGCCSDPVEFVDLNVLLNSDLSLGNTHITFKGSSSIDGRGNCLDLKGTSTIVIDSNAGLCFKDVTISGITQNNFYCTDSTSTVTFDNVKIVLESDWGFDAGKFYVLKDCMFIGNGYTFIYGTDCESLVTSNGRLIFDNNVTFKYAPSIVNRDLLSLYDSTSSLVLRGATLYATDVGMKLTKGNLVIERSSCIEGEGDTENESISFGDGVTVDNDIAIEYVGEANLQVLGGYVSYNNVSG